MDHEPPRRPPAHAPPWGAQTASALQHFAIGDDAERMPGELLRALVLIKGAAAAANARLGRLDAPLAQAIDRAAMQLLDRADFDACFPLALWQSGSGTQSHMNVNEVLARLASQALGGRAVHANDDVNRGQSSNDMVPSAMHVAVLLALQRRLLPALDALAATLAGRAEALGGIVKLGRTHLQDAVPLRLADEIGAWRSQLLAARDAIVRTMPPLHELAAGGTAVGSGLNTHPDFAAALCDELGRRTGLRVVPAADRYAALAGHEPLVALSGALKTLAVALAKLANDVRLLASGPRGGIGELLLPANEPGSSIMPGKVNPTQCEALAMVCCQLIGNDAALTAGAAGGHLQLNTFKPLIAHNLLRSIRLAADAAASFERHALRGLEADRARIAAHLQASLMTVTALAPHIGYDRAARIAQAAHASGGTLRDAALADGIDERDFARWTDPARLLGPAR